MERNCNRPQREFQSDLVINPEEWNPEIIRTMFVRRTLVTPIWKDDMETAHPRQGGSFPKPTSLTGPRISWIGRPSTSRSKEIKTLCVTVARLRVALADPLKGWIKMKLSTHNKMFLDTLEWRMLRIT
jgi:hypothetical protein